MSLRNNISTQKQNGTIYTPLRIVEYILNRVAHGRLHDKKICDPSCGSGNFLIVAVERIIAEHTGKKSTLAQQLKSQIYGFDIDRDALAHCHTRLNSILQTHNIPPVKWNLIHMDSTNKHNLIPFAGMFDFVVGNPPYIRIQHLAKQMRKQIVDQWKSAAYGCSDIYMAFFDIGLYLLNDKGRLGYITPNGYAKTESGRFLRDMLATNNLVQGLVDFGKHQIFSGVSTYTIITILDKGGKKAPVMLSRYDGEKIRCLGKMERTRLSEMQWDLCGKEEHARIQHIRNRGKPLHKIADIHVGLQTLADDVFILESISSEGNNLICKSANGKICLLEKQSVMPIVKASVMKNGIDPKKRVIICPYYRESLTSPKLIPESEMRSVFPLTWKYLLAHKERLLMRDKGAFAGVWYAYGREINIAKTLGAKILTSPINLSPNFMKCPNPESTFYSGYAVKVKSNLIDLDNLLTQLNSPEMDFFISITARDFRNGWKSYAKSFIKNFGVDLQYPNSPITNLIINQSTKKPLSESGRTGNSLNLLLFPETHLKGE